MTAPLSPPNPRRARRSSCRARPHGLPVVFAALVAVAVGQPAASVSRHPGGGVPASSAPGATAGPHQAGAAARTSLDWPHWRGPLGNGVAPRSDAPVWFSAAEGVAWKVEVPGLGQSSPVVRGDLVFVTTAVRQESSEPNTGERPRRRRSRLVEHDFRLIAYDRQDGSVAWSRSAIVTTPHEGYHRTLSSYANPSPVTDGRLVYAFFGSRGLYAYELDGTPSWSRDFGVQMQTFGEFGEASSPALYGDTIVVLFDHQEASFIEAVDARTGETRWRRARDEETSWSSPYIFDTGERTLVVASGGNFVTAYDLATGRTVWRAAGMTPHPIPTPVAGAGLLFAASGSTERRVVAIAHSGAAAGDIVWRMTKAAPYNPSPLLWDDELYLVRDGGLNSGTSRLSLLDADTGKPHYLERRFPGSYSIKASPVAAGEQIYLATEEGDVLVVRRGPEFAVLAINAMDEPFVATPAIAHGDLFLRGRQHLFRISDTEGR